ncbi:MAG: cation:proton antiporter [Magnetococcales bacterium]|nr:cation:proton antiporter [Magnetococcales bacterium]HIJ82830.1 cation:proton antiporter [Magnetococcales bacterium]
MSAIAIFFTQALLVVGLPYLVWRIPGIRRIVPLVVLQILLGLALGPSILGKYSPDLWSQLFSDASMQKLMGPSWLAIVLFTFLTGLHWQPDEFKFLGKRMLVMSLLSFLVPGFMGLLTGYFMAMLYPDAVGSHANNWHFAIAIGLSISVTALPVLGAILREMNLMGDRLGRMTLGMAALNDVILWCFLSIFLAGLVQEGGTFQSTLMIPVKIAVYLLVMVLVIKPLLQWVMGHCGLVGDGGLVAVFIAVFGSALATEEIGLHAALGGFMTGIILPRCYKQALIERLEPITVVLLLPFFFAMTGMKTSFDATSNTIISITVIAIIISMIGKFIGTSLPARKMGESWPDSIAIGILMQTKGMMEVLLLTIFRDANIISTTCFSAMMFMAIVTTSLTMPMLRIVMPWTTKNPPPPPPVI